MEKFLHIYLLISIIFSILFVVLGNEKYFSPLMNSTYINQAKERFMSLDSSKLQDPPMPSYTFTIYHRDVFEKSKFKDYDSLLENRLDRCEARASYLASIFDDVEKDANATLTLEQDARGGGGGNKTLEKVPKTTSIYLAHGEYVASFLVGSSRVKSFLQIDTGSDLVWWQCGPCEANKCYKQLNPLYVPSNSNTFRKIDCIYAGSTCLDDVDPATYKCNLHDSECTYDIKYTGGSRSRGFMADDVITFAFDNSPVRVMFGCGNDQTGQTAFSEEYSGVVGLGRKVNIGSYSLPSQFDADLMSLCLPSFYSTKSSTLSFHTTKWSIKTSAKLLQSTKLPLYYFVNLYKVFINDKLVPVSPSWWTITKGGRGGVHVDTGTTITRFPRDFYILFRYLFRREVGDRSPVDVPPLKSLDTCYKDDPGLYFPVVKLYFGSENPNNMLLLTGERVMVHFKGHYCLGFMGWDRSHTILGANQLQGIGLTFDTSQNTLSFDLDACD